MKNRAVVGSIALLVLMQLGCSATVPADKVYGSYVASYPFGTETITLNKDGSFVQLAAVEHRKSASAMGRWEFDAKESRVSLYGAMVVIDPYDRLAEDWSVPVSGIVSFDVERHWAKIQMNSAAKFPYFKT
jgi:hypothetical protein